jgi:addiction module HigA family antidote
MPTGSKSPTTTNRRERPSGRMRTVRLPRSRPPTHPGEMLLQEFILPLGIKQIDFARRIGVSFPRLNEVIHGKRAVSPDTALRLERVLGMPADFWLGLQLDWDLWHAARTPAAAKIGKLKPVEMGRKLAV